MRLLRLEQGVAFAAAAAAAAAAIPAAVPFSAGRSATRSRLSAGAQPGRRRRQAPSAAGAGAAADFMRRKCGGSPTAGGDDDDDDGRRNQHRATAVWVYTGSLQDPLTGREIATVEGVELVQGLASVVAFGDNNKNNNNKGSDVDGGGKGSSAITITTATTATRRNNSLTRFQRRCRNLQVAKALDAATTTTATADAVFGGTMLSRKLFCYTSSPPSGGKLLERINARNKMRPGGGPGGGTHIPADQAVTVYDTAISCLSTTSTAATTTTASDHHNNNTNTNDDDKWLLHTEWPAGKAVWSTVVVPNKNRSNEKHITSNGEDGASSTSSYSDDNNEQESSFEFSVFARLQTKPVQPEDLRRLLPAAAAAARDTTAAAPPPLPRSALVQFGGGGASSKGLGAAARETYRYAGDGTVRYTRYGEAPVWYYGGPGRACLLELTGRRLLLPLTANNKNNNNNDAVSSGAVATDSAADFGCYSAMIAAHVPVAATVIEQRVPGFWRFGAPAARNRPTWLPDDGPSRRSSRNNDKKCPEDPVFRYYASALHAALERADSVDGANTSAPSDETLSCADYRRYYADLAVGRAVDRLFRQGQQQQQHLVTEFSAKRHGSLQRWGEAAQSCWDKLRAATSISIGATSAGEP